MFSKPLLTAAVTGLLTLGSGAASAAVAPAQTGTWIPLRDHGTSADCRAAGLAGEQDGSLIAGTWQCADGLLLVRPTH